MKSFSRYLHAYQEFQGRKRTLGIVNTEDCGSECDENCIVIRYNHVGRRWVPRGRSRCLEQWNQTGPSRYSGTLGWSRLAVRVERVDIITVWNLKKKKRFWMCQGCSLGGKMGGSLEMFEKRRSGLSKWKFQVSRGNCLHNMSFKFRFICIHDCNF